MPKHRRAGSDTIAVGATVTWTSSGSRRTGVVVAVMRSSRWLAVSNIPSRFRAWPLSVRYAELSYAYGQHYVIACNGYLYRPRLGTLTVVSGPPDDVKALFKELSRRARELGTIVHRGNKAVCRKIIVGHGGRRRGDGTAQTRLPRTGAHRR